MMTLMGQRHKPLQDGHRRSHHLVVHIDVSLRCAQVLVTGQCHNHLCAHAAVRQLRDKPAPPAVTCRAINASLPVNLTDQLRQRVGQKVTIHLCRNQRRIVGLCLAPKDAVSVSRSSS